MVPKHKSYHPYKSKSFPIKHNTIRTIMILLHSSTSQIQCNTENYFVHLKPAISQVLTLSLQSIQNLSCWLCNHRSTNSKLFGIQPLPLQRLLIPSTHFTPWNGNKKKYKIQTFSQHNIPTHTHKEDNFNDKFEP